jgi:tetratricopeptide (TPR) repeat protein
VFKGLSSNPPSTAAERSLQKIVAAAETCSADGRYAEALRIVEAAFVGSRNDAKNAALTLAKASVLYDWGRIREARDTFFLARALGASPREVALKIGWCCISTGMAADAESWMAAAVEADPTSSAARFGLATALLNGGRIEEAQRNLQTIGASDPEYYESLIQLGELHLAERDLRAAETALRRAIEIQPRNPIGWVCLSAVLDRRQRSMEAAEAVEAAQRLEDETGADIDNRVNLALVRADTGRIEEAQQLLHTHLAARPSPSAHVLYGFLLLGRGHLREGWEHYEFRTMRENRLADRPRYGRPMWNGQSLQGRTILLRREQGFGDAIQFLRYAPLLKALGATVLLQVQPTIRDLGTGVEGVDAIYSDADTPTDFDYWIHLPSLPRIFATTLESIPAKVPYVNPSAEHSARWKARLPRGAKINIGLAWAGQPSHLRDWERSIALQSFIPLSGIEGVQLYSLQKGNASEEVARIPDFRITDLSHELADFSDTAAVIERMDLVISVDTAVAHLAGALARPVWLLLPMPCDFRWLENRDDSPWYPTMRLFRQRRRGDWSEVISRVAAALHELVAVTKTRPDRYRLGDAKRTQEITRALPPMPWPPQPDPPSDHAVAETRFGIVQYMPNDLPVGQSIRWYGEYLQKELAVFLELVRPGATVVEARAGVGLHALAIAAAVGDSGHAIVYEARALHRRVLLQNMSANGVRNVTVMRKPLRGGELLEAHDARGECIDELALERLDAVKINQGALAPAIVRGASESLWRLRPVLLISEIEPVELDSLVELTRDFSYRSWKMETPLFSPENFNRREEDAFCGRIGTALLCIPEEVDIDVRAYGLCHIS